MDSPVIASTLGSKHAADEPHWENGECFFWTGWRRTQWPAVAVAEGTRLYVVDLKRRIFAWIACIDRVAVFGYRSLKEFKSGVLRGTGWNPDLTERDVPRPTAVEKPCTGFAVRATLIRRVNVPLGNRRIPRLGWLDLSNGALQYDQPDLTARVEGRLSLQTHLKAERSGALRKAALTYWTTPRGHLRCAACDFDFERTYGARGAGFIEFHHVDPLGGTGKARNSKPTDLVPLCANCHRIIHRRSPILDVATLRAQLRRGRQRR